MDLPDPPHAPARPDRRATLGARGEDLAADHLAGTGLEVVARNWRLTSGELRGELDVVALDHDHAMVVVCEVKTRRGDAYGGPLAAVTPRKQARIRALTVALLTTGDLPYRTVRFDVVGVWLGGRTPRVEHVVAAF
jgi:putative endonuclease